MPDSVDLSCKTLQVLHKKYIKGTMKKAIVQEKTMLLCNLTKAVMVGCGVDTNKVFVTTRVLKHLYDKRPAVEYSLILDHLHEVVKFPDDVYQNKSGKRGSMGFCKKIGEELLFSSLEKVTLEDGLKEIYVATAFETDVNYLKNCTLIWNWRGGVPSS